MNVALVGYGKMGRAIERILVERGHSIGLIIDVDNATELTANNLRGIDVAIEFSTPATAYDNVRLCIEAGTPVVCGTTAWGDRLEEARELCRRTGGAFFYASNYSIGVNIFFKISEKLAQLMNRFPEYDVTVEEVHHTQKKDAPSGTAITIAEGIVAALDRKERWVGGTTVVHEELEVAAIRRSTVPGTHTVTYESSGELITLIHNVKSRDVLARGAASAAEFIVGKKGVFGMDDLLDFNQYEK
ncbi:MAG: 4-hydroxy-tetrahydrodipicolinate reductase [Rikenellaceae bacterium]|jgi:4-hydroxy-tetrahydrodipicolinate reductase|nr:4-hydroxy-tetrahydrodipicolinate reductase [Rikenellaceae bacterium]